MNIHINHLGPVEQANIDLNQITVLTGFQSSGKSTIAKTVYYFRTLKNDLSRQIHQYVMNRVQGTNTDEDLLSKCRQAARTKFINTFGTSYGMDAHMNLECNYNEDTYIRITLSQKDHYYNVPNYLKIHFSDNIYQKIEEIQNNTSLSNEETEDKLKELELLFSDPYQTVYIPAGRSLITLLGEQYLLFYSTLDDNGKRMIDECTQDFIRLIPVLKPGFSNGLRGFNDYQGDHDPVLKHVQELSKHILNGSYQFSNGEERLVLSDKENDYVRMNYASSGQQSSVWIINLIYYYLADKKKTCFIIEEPELNLFPESQKYMADLMMLAAHEGMQIIVTTHSPYILGEFNNILIASNSAYSRKQKEKLKKIIPDTLWTDYDKWTALFVKNGTIENIKDDELHQMNNDKLDAISSVINDEYDQIIECTLGDTED